MEAPHPSNEKKRLEALKSYEILDTDPEADYDDFAKIAAYICKAPIALISLIDERRQWFKARVGLDVPETDRKLAFCAHTILDTNPMVVPDATKDERFAKNDLVTGDPRIRFYAGAPLTTREGHNLGTICVIDQTTRDLEKEQLEALQRLSRQVVNLMEYRRVTSMLANSLMTIKTLKEFIPICSFCKSIRDDEGYWSRLESFLKDHAEIKLSHSICPDCLKKNFPEYESEDEFLDEQENFQI